MNVIAAVNADWGIGHGGTQSVVIREDRAHFVKLTAGGTVVMGRKTFEDIGGALPGRRNIVLTSGEGFEARDVDVARSVGDVIALTAGGDPDKVFIIGGGSVYRLFLPMCSRAFITKIETSPPSDTFFTDLDKSPDWALGKSGETRESGGVRYSFNEYVRISTD